jgi:hypothetical protein
MGCNGYSINNFVLCNKIENFVINLSELEDNKSSNVLDFLDKSCKMFDMMIDDQNEISNIVNILYRKYNIISSMDLELIQNFIFMHKRCGLYITLKIKEVKK